VGCGVEVGVHQGRVLAVRGDVKSPVNHGLLCVKGYHLPAILYAKDRLLYPMKRRPDGKGFVRISWNEALDLIAARFKQTLDKHGPGAVAVYGSGQWTVFDGYAALKWDGAPPVIPHGPFGVACTSCHSRTVTDLFAESHFRGLRQDLQRGSRYPGAPPIIPHGIFMRESCAACHGGLAAREEIRCTHPERARCQQCHVPAVVMTELSRP
jgi:nitrate reductase NapA